MLQSFGIILLFFSVFGLGLLPKHFFKIEIPSYYNLIFGLILVGPLFILGNILLGFNFTFLTFIVIGLAISGFFLDRKQLKEHLKEILFESPVGICLFAYVVAIHILKIVYTPRHWDEFSYWLTYPKQMMLFDQLVSAEFYDKTFLKYMPGFSALQIFSQKLHFQNTLNTDFAFAPNYLFGLTLLWWFSSVMRQLLKEHSDTLKVALVWLIGFLFLFMCAKTKILMPNSRIELPCIAVLLCGLWSLYCFLNGRITRKNLIIIFSILMVGGYALKEFYIILPPAFAVFLFLYDFPKKHFSIFNFVTEFMASILLFVSLYVTWKFATMPYAHVHNLSLLIEQYGFWGAFKSRVHLLGFALFEFIQYFIFIFLTIFPLLGLKSLFKKKYLPFAGFLFAFCTLYLGALMWWYLFNASPVEAEALASFDRYLSYFFLPLLFLGLVLYLENLSFRHPFFLKIKSKIPTQVSPIVFSFFFIIPTLGYLPKKEVTIQTELAVVSEKLFQFGKNVSQVSLIDSQDNGFFDIQTRFYSMDHANTRGRFHPWSVSTDFNPNQALWLRHVDINQSDIPKTLATNCPADISFHLLIFENSAYQCYPLKSPASDQN